MSSSEKKKILIIGNANSLWLKRYVEHVLDGSDYEIHMQDVALSEFRDFYESKGVTDFPVETLVPSFLKKIRKVPVAIILVRLALKRFLGMRFDCIHIQFVSRGNVRIGLCAGGRASKYIASFWGSDLLRIDSSAAEWLDQKFDSLDAITIQDRSTMKDAFAGRFADRHEDRLYKVLFPGENDAIVELETRETLAESKELVGLPTDRYIVAIGYNANPMQQHMKVLNELAKLPIDLQSKLHLVFLLTYPNAYGKYRQQLRAYAEGLSCTCSLFEGSRSDIEIARIQRSCDMFIHAQVSDAASSSVKEFLKAGCLLLNPAWIRYEEWRKQGVAYIEYSSFGEIPGLVKCGLEGNVDLDVSINKDVLREKAPLAEIRKKWLSIYAALLSNDKSLEQEEICPKKH